MTPKSKGPPLRAEPRGDAFLADCAHGVAHGFGITHATFQVEIGEDCASGDSC